MVRRAMPVVVLAALLAVAWMLLRQGDEGVDEGDRLAAGNPPGADAPPAPIGAPGSEVPTRLQGRPGRQPAVERQPREGPGRRRLPVSTAGLIRYEGTVRGEDGRPLVGAEVYQTPKRRNPEQRWRNPRVAKADAEGRFVLHARPDMDDVFAAQAHGYETTFVDGAAAAATKEIHFVLREMPRLVVRIVDTEGEPLAWAGVRVVPTERRGRYIPHPGPGWPRPPQFETTDAEGTAVFGYDVPLPVMIIPEVEGFVTEPPEQWLPQAAGTVVFTALRGTTLVLDVVDEQGTAVDGSVWAEIRDGTTADALAVIRGGFLASVLAEDLALPAGTYAVEITAPGYEPCVIRDLALPGGGAEVKREVVMRPLRKRAWLTVTLPKSEPPRKAGARRVTLLFRRVDEGWDALGWAAHTEVKWRPATEALCAPFQPGTYEVLVVAEEDVATLGTIALAEGAQVERRAHPRKGVVFPLHAILPPDLTVRSIRFEVPGFGHMPALGWTFRGSGNLLETIDPAGSAARRDPDKGALIGPYPGTHVTLVVTDWRGTVHRFAAAR
jgi:hypothetical protein